MKNLQIFQNSSKNANHRHLLMTGTDHYHSMLSKIMHFQKDIALFELLKTTT